MKVGMCGIAICLIIQRAVGAPVSMSIQERKVTICRHLCGELNLLINTV
jgi:hypothetical protein